MNLRPYQSEAADAVNEHLMARSDNPLVSIPTAGGKTIVFASLIQQWMQAWPATRIVILAHVKELLAQAEDKLLKVWPTAPVGVWSAGMGRREGSHPILVAGIQSIYKRAFDFEPWDIIIVDEAHLIPPEGEGMYRSFITDCRKANPNVRVLGFTATPYRLDGGHIAQADYILNHTCYAADIGRLISEGYLCKLTSKATETRLDATGVKIRQGDYVTKDLEKKINTDDLVSAACREIIAKGQDRRSWLIFCCGVDHARNVAACLSGQGIETAVVTGESDKDERAGIIQAFDAGRIRAVANVNCLTTGLDVTRIDLIALLRPTQSTSLYVQMVGRGFRLHPEKESCLILDFGENVLRHGPVDAVQINFTERGDGEGEPPAKKCPQCAEIVAAAALVCTCCGFEFPPREIKHQRKAHEVPIISESEPWEMDVEHVEARYHRKCDDKPPTMRVIYSRGMESHSEWVCFEHGGYPRQKAEQWWKRRFKTPCPTTVEEALASNMFFSDGIAALTERIKVKKVGKYTEIVSVALRTDQTAIAQMAGA